MWKASICSGERRLPTEGDFVWLLPREKQKNQKLFAYLKEREEMKYRWQTEKMGRL